MNRCVCEEIEKGSGLFLLEAHIGKNKKVLLENPHDLEIVDKFVTNHHDTDYQGKDYKEADNYEEVEEKGGTHVQIFLNSENELSLYGFKTNKRLAFTSPGHFEFGIATKIKYCPFCGKNLEEGARE